ncbi:MAG TPA: protein kinase, partial [Gemmataceae bacterium]|nr:protein kinase [Gemmataceae bacterium]
MTEASIFAAALEKATDEERAAYLGEACAGDDKLRRRVQALLRAHAEADDLLDPSSSSVATADDAPIAERPGTRIGPYRLMEQIGEGGFGLVFVAEQQEPIRRKVALKIIKPGMDSKQVIARFEAERQALALMDHPNIARVLDAGATESGQPYFVMELVRGIPITDYCDQNLLTPRERLELFVTVCHAIQHAHHKGIIHRDVKPSNVLVTLHDGKPVAKVIDFGVAKAIHQHLTERTIYTNFAQMIGTPLYMSPEQAEMSGLDIDTRSDIYSLGVLLYELLTGSTPLAKKRFATAAYDEIRRLIREEEPPRPSQRLSTSDTLPSLAASRKTEPAKLSRMMRGELDWIVMKALEKDRTRRYETANGLARDIERHLADEAVEACPPSASYRLRKFARKNRAALTTAAAVTLLLLTGAAVSGWQAARAMRAEAKALEAEAQARQERADADDQRRLAERRESEARDNERKARAAEAAAKESDATANEVLEFVKNNVFAAARPPLAKIGLGRDVTLRKALDSAEPKIAVAFATRPRVEAQLRAVLGYTYAQLNEEALALAQLERAYALAKLHYGQDDKFTADLEFGLAREYLSSGRSVEALRLLEQSLARRRQTLGLEHPVTVVSLGNLTYAYRELGRSEEAKKVGAELLQYRVKQGLPTEDADQVLHLAFAYNAAGRTAEAARLLEESLPRLTAKLGPEDPKILLLTYELAVTYRELGRTGDALALIEPAYGSAVRTLGQTNWLTLRLMQNLTVVASGMGRSEDVVRILEAAIPNLRSELGPASP